MTALVNALDNYTPTQFGEKCNVEYGWSNSIQEKILQFSFQITRTDEVGVKKLSVILRDLLASLKNNLYSNSLPERQVAKGYMSILYRMIGHTRDIIDGKGECLLSYMMIYTWYEFYPELATFALRCLVDLGDKDIHQYGSWKDIKYFCDYCSKEKGESNDHPLIKFAIKLVNEQLSNDYVNYISNTNDISLTAKWAPREKSSFGWLYAALATDYYSQYLITANNESQSVRAVLKCKTEYRKLLSTLNKAIDTLQIKQCGHNWSCIDHAKTTSITFMKQSKALYNVDKKGQPRSREYDRELCAEQLKEFVDERVKSGKEIKGGRIGMADFTKKAGALIASRRNSRHEVSCLSEIALLNSQWRDSSSLTGSLSDFVAMVDTSGSMHWEGGDPYNVAVSLGIRVAEKSTLGKRVMTFSSNPTWVRLSGDYIDMVEQISKSDAGTGTDFYKALDLILQACCENNVLAEVVAKMVLVIFSDMQIDAGDSGYKSMHAGIVQKYRDAGYNQPPHILFWNLRSTGGFPTLMSEPNVSAMSGFSPALLNAFCEKGVEGLASANPWDTLLISLYKERYGQMIRQI